MHFLRRISAKIDGRALNFGGILTQPDAEKFLRDGVAEKLHADKICKKAISSKIHLIFERESLILVFPNA